jgi:hypothetical protein
VTKGGRAGDESKGVRFVELRPEGEDEHVSDDDAEARMQRAREMRKTRWRVATERMRKTMTTVTVNPVGLARIWMWVVR